MTGDRTAAIHEHLEILRTLRTSRGLFLASVKGVPTGYDKAWLRDNFYTSHAFEAAGDWETVSSLWRAILEIFLKHEGKIDWAVTHKPHQSWQYIHARYHPETFEEFWDEWGNKQNDAVGATLFKLGDLEAKGHGVIESNRERRIVQRLIDYLNSVEYWHDPDSGVWEEREEVHASSVGAGLAGLKKVSALPFVKMPAGVIEKGEEALRALLPRESKAKFADLALLSLIWPFEIVSTEMAEEIITNVEYHLTKRLGVIRYKGDYYYNKNSDGWSEEAEWTMGFPWLAVIHKRRGDLQKAGQYLERAYTALTADRKLPELYFSNTKKPNENIPLGWAESLFVVALTEVP